MATDSTFADTPAVDCGYTIAQVYYGTKSHVTDVFGVKMEKQFVNTLQDNIKDQGAMDKLITDSAQSETSTKVKNVLQHLIISDW